jgi:hypothetical protein
LTEKIKHLICASATVIGEEINGRGSCKSETETPKMPPWVRRIQESANGIRKELTTLVAIRNVR